MFLAQRLVKIQYLSQEIQYKVIQDDGNVIKTTLCQHEYSFRMFSFISCMKGASLQSLDSFNILENFVDLLM